MCNLAYTLRQFLNKRFDVTYHNLMGVHWAGQEESGVVRSVELVTKHVDGRDSLDVILRAQVGR